MRARNAMIAAFILTVASVGSVSCSERNKKLIENQQRNFSAFKQNFTCDRAERKGEPLPPECEEMRKKESE